MATENEIFDDIAARLAAIKFMVRQLFSAYARSTEEDPIEVVAMLQASTADILRRMQEAILEGEDRARFQKQSIHIARIYEDVLRGVEGDAAA